MTEGPFDPKGFSGVIPVFPLPNVVLFPGMFLPLHIFEPRYRAMTKDVLEGERLLAMALLKPGWQKDYEGTPAIHPIVGIGKVVEDARLDDGRYNLVLFGLIRARVVQELPSGPYRSARVELLEETTPPAQSYERRRRTLIAIYTHVMKDLTGGGVAQPPDDVPLGMLCDLVASLFRFEMDAKQALLEELDAGLRCDQLLKMLEGQPEPGRDPRPPQRSWPMGPSLN